MKPTIEDIIGHITFNQEFEFIEQVCDYYTIRYDQKLLDQVLDRYNILDKKYKKDPYGNKYLVLKNFLECVEEQFKSYHKNNKLRF